MDDISLTSSVNLIENDDGMMRKCEVIKSQPSYHIPKRNAKGLFFERRDNLLTLNHNPFFQIDKMGRSAS